MSRQSYGSSRRPGSFRRKIPTALVAVFGCEEVTKSLRRFPGANVETKCGFLASATDDLFTRALQEAAPGQLSGPAGGLRPSALHPASDAAGCQSIGSAVAAPGASPLKHPHPCGWPSASGELRLKSAIHAS